MGERRTRAGFALLAALLACPPCGHAQTPEQPATEAQQAPSGTGSESCASDVGEPRVVAKVVDGETIALADGGEVRLVGALAPRAFDAGVAGADWPAENDARTALAALVVGKSVSLASAGRRHDRYGRALAQVFVDGEDGSRLWVQGALVEAGAARAYGLPDSFSCVDELVAREAAARSAGRGLWANPAYAVRRADLPRELLRLRNTYQIVEGRVAHVGDVRGHVYLNFGADWRDDFTAGIVTTRQDRSWLDEMRGLAGRRVRVRGWIERQNGPFIAVSDRSQIELLEGEPATSAEPASRDAGAR